ncbi:polysaccharide deacetylase family protein [Paenibacillus sabinae]|uniref:NodB homology domain-containing protein n=1 Tax=Paenibacillus sabinae T27 TaxID=1268072 RepID=X4ZHI7_9BACL|nr:polysaccharide deacetylase family protein [Paenibacillus sabinae]AHV98976.1 hypothetical protein PSAB_20425 [Paenibacillus sabinae T27]
MAQLPMYAAAPNSPATELAAAITDVATTITVLDASKLPDAPNLATIGVDETAETVLYTGKSGNDLTGCTRGFSGTVAKAWAMGAQVARYFTSYDADAMRGNIEEHSAQLAETATRFKTKQAVFSSSKIQRPLCTIIDDDGHLFTLTNLKPLLDTYGFPGCAAIVTDYAATSSNHMNFSQIIGLQAAGWEIMSHSKTHPHLPDLSEAQIISEISQSKAELISNGLDVKGIVYPYGSNNGLVRTLSKEYYEYGFAQYGINYPPLHSMRITRITLGEDENLTLANFKGYVDTAIANNGWFVLCLHSYSVSETQWDNLIGLIDYLDEKRAEIDVVTANEAMSAFGNVVEAWNEETDDYFAVGANGEAYSNAIYKNFQTKYNTGLTASSPISSFDHDKVTVTTFLNADNSGFPKQSAGILYTYRDVRYDDFSYQKWYPLGQNSVYVRFWNNVSNAWQNWKEYGAGVFTTIDTINARTASDLASAYPAGAITHTVISGVGQGFPTSSGRLVTDRIDSADNGFQYQYWYPAGSTDIQFRVTNFSGAWTSWETIATKRSATQNIASTIIPAHSSVDKVVTANGTTINSLIQAHPVGGLEAGLVFSAYYYSDGNVVIRLANITTASITTAARDWQIVNG